MQAIVYKRHGGPEAVACSDIQTPEPGTDQVRIHLRAAALNHLDLWVREGWPGLKLDFPHIPGADGAGEVDAIGGEVTGFNKGDRVAVYANISCGRCTYCLAGRQNMCREWHLLGETIFGTYAEYVVVPAGNLYRLPETVSFTTAAAGNLVYVTAWHSLITRGRLQPGESVLIVGASGGVNLASIQIAKLAGAKVFVVGSSKEKLALAESVGADVLIDRTKEENWSKAVYSATDRTGVDIVVDNVGAKTMVHSLRAVRKGGRILTVGNTSGAKFEIDNRFIFGKHLSILGSTMGTPNDFATVMNLIIDGSLQPVIDREYQLKDAPKAFGRLESGTQMGKITLVIP